MPAPASARWVISADGTYMPRWFKDGDDVLDYTLDWRHKLPDDDIVVSANFIAHSDLTVLSINIADAVDFDADGVPTIVRADSACTAWISGGLLGRVYDVICRVVTREGRQMDRTFQLVIGQN